MSEDPEKYWGITDDRIIDIGMSEADSKFILKVFGPKEKYESWASHHDDPKAMRTQCAALASNMMIKQQELMDDLLFAVIGKPLTDKQRAKHVCMKKTGEGIIRWVCWRRKVIAVTTNPITYVKNSRYFLRWYWCRTPLAKKRIAQRLGLEPLGS